MMRTATLAALCWLAGGAPTTASVDRYHVSHRLEEGGAVVRETVSLRVSVETESELDEWRWFPVFLDVNRSIVRLEAWTVAPGGDRRQVKERELDTVETLDTFELHSSSMARVVPFSELVVGGSLELDYEIESRPWYPAQRLRLLPGVDSASSVRFELSGSAQEVDFVLEGPAEAFETELRQGGLVVEATQVEIEPAPPQAAVSAGRLPVLHYTWGSEGWSSVGLWYRQLVRDLSQPNDSVRALAAELTAGLETPRQRLEALTGWIRSQVRYVAVEVGIGGFRLSPAPETLERRWGDCKDKSQLLIELLREAGIEAWPVLIRLDDRDRIESRLASPFHFNHLIVAVERQGLATAADDPLADGFFFVDPTQDVGAAHWLHPGVQDQEALVVMADSARLVRTPLLPQTERIELDARLAVGEDGSATGTLLARWVGDAAVAILRRAASSDDSANSSMMRDLLRELLPRAELDEVEFLASEEGVPTVEVSAKARVRRFVRGRGGRSSLRLEQPVLTPRLGPLAERKTAVVLWPRQAVFRWQIDLPGSYCASAVAPSTFENAVGRVLQSVRVEGERLTVEREVQILRRWVDVPEMVALEAAAAAEEQTLGRRLRLGCSEDAAD
ncbi:MAG: transglutaminase-like domain-containing protein [Acidobacteriota bacterium]